MAELDSLPFYQQFYTETIFILPEKEGGTNTISAPVALPANKVAPTTTLPEPLDDGAPTVRKFTFIGGNQKGLALLFSLPETDFAALPKNEFLTKILAAIQHTPADVAYVNIPPNTVLNLFDLTKETEVKRVVVFGENLLDLASGFKINLYKPAGIGPTPLLLADPLPKIEKDVNRKKLLWTGLQEIFFKA